MKLLLYCTKAKPYLSLYEEGYGEEIKLLYGTTNDKALLKQLGVGNSLNGKIVAECDFEVEKIELLGDEINIYYGIENKACLTTEQIENYLGYDNDYKGYAIHIKNLHIFDKPRELNCYHIKKCQYAKYASCKYGKDDIHCSTLKAPIEKAPQNMMYCYGNNTGERYILISIQSQWLCKILNGEKTIEVRKKVLKDM